MDTTRISGDITATIQQRLIEVIRSPNFSERLKECLDNLIIPNVNEPINFNLDVSEEVLSINENQSNTNTRHSIGCSQQISMSNWNNNEKTPLLEASRRRIENRTPKSNNLPSKYHLRSKHEYRNKLRSSQQHNVENKTTPLSTILRRRTTIL